MPDVSAQELHLTAQETADLLGVSLRTVERMQADGALTPVYLPRKRRRFRTSDVRALKNGSAA